MRLLAATLLLMVVSCSAPQAALPTPTEAASGLRLTGDGPGKSDPMNLSAGDYLFAWMAEATPIGSCAQNIWLRSLDDPNYRLSLASVLVERGKSTSSQSNAYNLPAGRYYLEMPVACRWSVTVTQR